MAADQFSHALIRHMREVHRLLAACHLLDWRQAKSEHLNISVNGIHRAKPRVEVPHRREIAAASQSPQEIERRSAGYLTETLQAVRRNNVRKGVDDGQVNQAPVRSR